MDTECDGHAHAHNHGTAPRVGAGEGEEQLARRSDPKGGVANTSRRQEQYGRALRTPLGKINAEMRRAIVSRDVLGYHDDTVAYGQVVNTHDREQLAFDPDSLTPGDFDLAAPAAKQKAFMAWLKEQEEKGLLTIIHKDGNVFIQRALTDGDKWAVKKLKEKGVTGISSVDGPGAFDLPPGDGTFGDVSPLAAPIRASKVRLLYERNFALLKGITEDMNAEIRDVLASGMAQGLNPTQIAANISDRVESVGKHRATLLARHEVMYAHNEAAKARYREQGVKKVEWLGSDPCPVCLPFVGEIYDLGNIPHDGPPLHPQCVGVISPVVDW